MKARIALITCLLAGIMAPALADNGMAGMNMSPAGHKQGSMQNMPLSEGVIRKVDAAAGKVTIRHGELANLGMPPMTMTFTASDHTLLKGYKAGDKVRFRADESDNGALMVTQMSHMQ